MQLAEFGLVEGSRRTHKGQGTTNRKFYFDNFFLEILWVINEEEINQSPALETQLGQRANFEQNGFSRFGLCLVNTEETDQLFKKAEVYQPHYFPPGMAIDFLSNTDHPKLPWTFRLPYRGGKKGVNEPTRHLNRINKLTRVEFEIGGFTLEADYIACFAEEKGIMFTTNSPLNLILEFDSWKQNKVYRNEDLALTIRY